MLVLTKMDRLIVEKKLTPTEAYAHLQQVLEQVRCAGIRVGARARVGARMRVGGRVKVSARARVGARARVSARARARLGAG